MKEVTRHPGEAKEGKKPKPKPKPNSGERFFNPSRITENLE